VIHTSWLGRKEKKGLVHDFIVMFVVIFPFKRIWNTRAVYLRLNPTCMCSIVHPASSFEELCAVYLSC
jgi:hypothetical protein